MSEKRSEDRTMALMTCPHCGKTTSDKEQSCIHCGRAVRHAATPRFDGTKRRFFLMKLWRGEYSLVKAFWGFYFLVNFILNTIAYTQPDLFTDFFRFDSARSLVSFFAFFFLYFGYLFVSLVGVWRSAAAYSGSKLWPALARIYVTLSALNTLRVTHEVFVIPLMLLWHLKQIGAI